MKRTRGITLGLTSAMAAALLACGPRRELARCVDYSDNVVDDSLCDQMERDRARGFSTHFYPYRWYYGGYGFGAGTRATGGNYAPSPGATTVRGGFGSTGAGHAGGAGE